MNSIASPQSEGTCPPGATDPTGSALLRWGFFPCVLALTLAYVGAEVQGAFGPLGSAYPFFLGVLIAALLLLEWRFPLRRDWGMTRRLFLRRDVPMLLINGAAMATAAGVVTALAAALAGLWARHGGGAALWPPSTPWPLQALAALALADLGWYAVHRYSHEGRGPLGRWLWRTHVMHHLPEQVYVLMHAAGHPVQAAYVRVILLLPPLLLGLSPQAAFAASVVNGVLGLLSHFNVDARAGALNALLIGPELHRLHHSADPEQARNYAAVFSLWDRLFGSYRAAEALPAALGVPDRAAYPPDGAWRKLLALPFRC